MNTLNVLSNISGLSKKDIKQIAKEVMENNKLLKNCKFHNFTIVVDKRKFKCTNCGGVVAYSKKYWYELGLTHKNKI